MKREFFLRQKTCWRLTLQSKCILLLVLVLGIWVFYEPFLVRLHIFLTPTSDLTRADALVVEGWVFDSGKRLAENLYKRGYGKYIITTGGPILRSAACFEYGTWAEVARKYFISAAIDKARVIPVTTPVRGTREEALALRSALEKHRTQSIIVITQKGHERRSYLAFRKALRDLNIAVMVTAAEEDWFRADNWWKSHDGLIYLFVEYLSLGYYWFKGFI